jgi:hypothetical protein
MPEHSTSCRPQGHCQLTGVKSDDRLLDRVNHTVNCEPPVSELFLQIFRHDRNKHDTHMVRNFAAIYRPGVLLCSQEHIIGLYPQPGKSIQHSYPISLRLTLILSLRPHRKSPKRSPPAIILCLFISPTRVKIPSNLIHPKIVNLVMIFYQPYT